MKKGRPLFILFFLGVTLFASRDLYAQENQDLVVELINRVGALEAEQRELRGQLDEARHEVSLLQKKMETLNADVDYRLNNPEGGSDPLASPAPDSLEEEVIEVPPSSTAEEEYEKARTLLEKGEYEAAEKAFTAFVKAHPKHDQAGAAQYWLGVTFFVRGEHEKAAGSFAKGYKNYPKSPKAADGLLKLALCLIAIDRKADACSTLEQLSTEYPKAHVKEIARKRKELGCK